MEYNQNNSTIVTEDEEFEEIEEIFDHSPHEDDPTDTVDEIDEEEGYAEVDLTGLNQLYGRVQAYAQENEVDVSSKIEHTKEELKELHKLQSTDYVKYEIDEVTQQLQSLEKEFVEKENLKKGLARIEELLEDISFGYEGPQDPEEDIDQDEVPDEDNSQYDAYNTNGVILQRHFRNSTNHENAVQAVESFLDYNNTDISDDLQVIHFLPEKETGESEDVEVMDKRSNSITDQVTATYKLHTALLNIVYLKAKETSIIQEQESLEEHSDDIEDFDEDILSESPVPIIRKHLIGNTNKELALYMQKNLGADIKPVVTDEETAEDMGLDPGKVSEYLVYIDTDAMLNSDTIDALVGKYQRSKRLYEKRVKNNSDDK